MSPNNPARKFGFASLGWDGRAGLVCHTCNNRGQRRKMGKGYASLEIAFGSVLEGYICVHATDRRGRRGREWHLS